MAETESTSMVEEGKKLLADATSHLDDEEKEDGGANDDPDTSREKAKTNSAKQKLLDQAQSHLKKLEEAQAEAKSSREKANGLEDGSEEQQAALEHAQKFEKIAGKELKIVKRLQSGVWQGGLGGAGIGAGVGMGVGTVVGTVVGGVAAIPTTGLGALVGAGTGAVHGPWFKVPRSGGDGEGKEGEGGEEGEPVTEEEMEVNAEVSKSAKEAADV